MIYEYREIFNNYVPILILEKNPFDEIKVYLPHLKEKKNQLQIQYTCC